MPLSLYDLAGFVGAAVIAVAYFAVQQRWLDRWTGVPGGECRGVAADTGLAVVRMELPVGRDRGLLGGDQPWGSSARWRTGAAISSRRREIGRNRAEKAG